jgi:predicted nuclease of predicted toxin-antitoxin system
VPKLAFLADMNISPLTVLHLKGRGWNIIRVSEVMDKSTKDLGLLEYARRHDMVIITQDLDFSMLLAVKGYGKPSLVNVRLEETKPAYVTSRIIDTVTALEPELAKGAVVTVDETSVRYRYLPIRTEVPSASEK